MNKGPLSGFALEKAIEEELRELLGRIPWLKDWGRKWTQQDLRLHSQPRVSIGLVNKVVRHLHDEAFIQELRDGGFKLSAPLDLLTAWRDAYRFDRHQRRGYFSRLQGRQLQEKLASLESIMGGHALMPHSPLLIFSTACTTPKNVAVCRRGMGGHFSRRDHPRAPLT